MNGCQEVKEDVQDDCEPSKMQGSDGRAVKGMTIDEALLAGPIVRYGPYYIGVADPETEWNGTECVEVLATKAAHARFIAGKSRDEQAGRIGVLLEALGDVICDFGVETFVSVAVVSGKPAPQVRVALVKSHFLDGLCLLFMLPEEGRQRPA